MNEKESRNRLVTGNAAFLAGIPFSGDTSEKIRQQTAEHGQHPWAAVVACSDSRVAPELIFHAGIGEIFTIRTAGNTIGPGELASVEYAAEHLGVPLVVVLGHTDCGAVKAALKGDATGHIKSITDMIRRAAGVETDPDNVCVKNILQSVESLRAALAKTAPETIVRGAIYRLETGRVSFIEG